MKTKTLLITLTLFATILVSCNTSNNSMEVYKTITIDSVDYILIPLKGSEYISFEDTRLFKSYGQPEYFKPKRKLTKIN